MLNQNKDIVLTRLGLLLIFPLITKVISKTVTIGKKTTYKFCWKGVHIKKTNFTSRARFCGLSDDTLNQLKEEDKVILKDLGSSFGFEVKTL
jgi:hypothetical protein